MSGTVSSQLKNQSYITFAKQQTPTNLQFTQQWIAPSRETYLRQVLPDDLDTNHATIVLNLKYESNGQYMFDTENFESVLEIINLFKNPEYSNYTLEQKFGFLVRASQTLDQDLVWALPSSSLVIKQYEYEYKLSKEKPVGSSYKGKCKNRSCANTTLFDSYEVQTRSADEAQSSFVKCLVCGIRWSES